MTDTATTTPAFTAADVEKLSFTEQRVIRDRLYTADMKRKIDRLDRAAGDLESAASDALDAAHSMADEEDDELRNAPVRDVLLARLHAWHDSYHAGAFRLCREPQCSDIGWGTFGPAPLTLMPVAS